MNRAYSLLSVKSIEEVDDQRVIRGTATTPEPDRYGDIVDPMGVQFKNPLPLLHQHDSKRPVGTVKFDKPTKDGITFEARIAKIAEPGALKERVDTAWGEIKAGLVRAVSIGFRALEYSFMEDGGIRFMASEVLELSLVTVPANSGAFITEIKSIDGPMLAASGKKPGPADRPVAPGATGKTTKPVKAKEAREVKKPISEQIAAFQATRDTKSARMDAIIDQSAEKGETLDAEQKEEYDTLEREVKEVDEHLVRLRAREKSALTTAKEVKGGNEAEGNESRSNGRNSIIQVRGSQLPKGVGFVRLLGARFMAKEDGCSPADIAISKGWGDDLVSILKTPRSVITKAAIGAATTTDSTWAAPLVTYQNLQGEFIELLRAKELISRIPGLRRVPFNVKVPRETGETTGYWVAQASPKPVSKGAFDTVTLDWNKVAGITFQTQELLKFSQPNSEQLLVNSLTKALIKLVDKDFLDPAKAVVTGESPASITNGSTSIAASGTTADAFRADFADLLAAYTMANYTLDDLVIVMSQSQALRLGLMRNDFGVKEFADVNKDGGFIEGIPVVTTENIASNGGSPADGWIIVALSAGNILLADDGGVDVDISTEASIQTDSAPDSPPGAGTVLVSLWQNNMVGIRCERFVTWVKARTNAAVYITGGNYGN